MKTHRWSLEEAKASILNMNTMEQQALQKFLNTLLTPVGTESDEEPCVLAIKRLQEIQSNHAPLQPFTALVENVKGKIRQS